MGWVIGGMFSMEMLTVKEWEQARRAYHVEEKTIREIARDPSHLFAHSFEYATIPPVIRVAVIGSAESQYYYMT